MRSSCSFFNNELLGESKLAEPGGFEFVEKSLEALDKDKFVLLAKDESVNSGSEVESSLSIENENILLRLDLLFEFVSKVLIFIVWVELFVSVERDFVAVLFVERKKIRLFHWRYSSRFEKRILILRLKRKKK